MIDRSICRPVGRSSTIQHRGGIKTAPCITRECGLAFAVTLLTAAGCSGQRWSTAGAECRPPAQSASLPEDAVSFFEGRFTVQLVGTGGSATGQKTDGDLILWSRPDSLQSVVGIDLAEDPDLLEIAFGSFEGDLEAVDAYVEGSLSSRDPAEPGVVVRRRRPGRSNATWGYTLQFGSGRNERAVWILDGASTEAVVATMDRGGFAGFWESQVGPTTHEASGYFCATRVSTQR